MSFLHRVLLVCLISFSAALILVFTGFKLGYEEFRRPMSMVDGVRFPSGYAVLSVDASVDDYALRSLLQTGNDYFYGAQAISESSQWVLLDEFDSLQKIPLDRYFSRILAFDPRNDGYAEKLRELFLRDGKRFVYIPLKTGNWNSSQIDNNFSSLLGDIDFFADYYGIGRASYLYFFAYAAASLCFLVIYFITRKRKRDTGCVITLIPVFSSLVFFGAPGIVCAALLIAFFTLFKEFLKELEPVKKGVRKVLKDIILPYRFHWFCLPLLAVAFFLITFLLQLKLLFTGAVITASAAVFLLSERIISQPYREHRRFAPILIIKRRFPESAFPLYMLPFAVAAFFVIFAAPYMPASYDSENQFNHFISEQDYYAHLNHQAFFSKRQMSTSSTFFPSFFFDTDGLPSMEIYSGMDKTVNTDDFPPFPLKYLMEFFYNVNSGQVIDTGKTAHDFFSTGRNNWSLLVLLLFILPGLFSKRKGSNDGYKRIGNSGKFRLKGINWNKMPVYNDRNQLRVCSEVSSIQKDA
jgi:hypothetical protein